MTVSILSTKLYIPRPRTRLVVRPRLTERLNRGLQGKLTLVSAPAGFGKSTLIGAWVLNGERPAAWLSLDERDRELVHFLTYLVAALQTVVPRLGPAMEAALQAPQLPSLSSLLTPLLNQIAAAPEPFLLVLDDYHVLDNPAIDGVLTFLLENLPPQMHLVITTREDPALPLSRLRARGDLTEIRIAELRFTTAEAGEFLNEGMGLDLMPTDVALLESRTEGWVAGLQMAAISLRGRDDPADFLQSFSGSHRFILDYLVDEVLQQQSDRVREFLFQTSILGRLNAALCDAVTGQSDARAILSKLERGNMLIIPLDDERQWYRYHPLFADVLRAYVEQEHLAEIPRWQRRACDWYEQHGFRAEAIHFALAANDTARAADLVELSWPVILNGFQPTTWLRWVEALPNELVRARPVLSAGYAWALLDIGAVEAAETRLRDVEAWLLAAEGASEDAAAGAIGMTVANETQFAALAAVTAGARAYLALTLNDLPAAIQHAQHALDLLAENDHYWRGTTGLLLGLAHWAGGSLDDAVEAIRASIASQRRAKNHYFQIFGMVILANIRVAQGRLQEAHRQYQQALQRVSVAKNRPSSPAKAQDTASTFGSLALYVGLSELHYQWGDLDAALTYVETGQAALEQAVLPDSVYRLWVVRARIAAARGHLDEALNHLFEAERRYQRAAVPDFRPLDALITRVQLRQGRVDNAAEWMSRQGLVADDALSYQREFEHMTLARVLLARHRTEPDAVSLPAITDLLTRLLTAAEAGGRNGSCIEILILQALVHQAQGASDTALALLGRALTLAAPEDSLQVFVDEGDALSTLLAASLSRGGRPAFVKRILDRMPPQQDAEATAIDPNQRLLEPLSTRELEVLRLLVKGLSNQAIADALVIALSTVKKHINNIYGKLGVSSRTQASHRARELDLL